MPGFMNPQRGRHMDGGGVAEHHGHLPHIHIHSHENGHTVHIMHPDGRHEKHEHDHGDSEGMAEHVHHYLGGEQRPENEDGMGGEGARPDGGAGF